MNRDGFYNPHDFNAIKKLLKSKFKLKKKNKKRIIKIIIFNDGSKDKTIKYAKNFQNNLNLNIIDNKKNQGLGIAINSLILYFKKKSKKNDKLVLMDCDNTHNPNQILEMVKKGQK